MTDDSMQLVAQRHLGSSFINVLERNVGIGVVNDEREEKKKKRGRKIKSGTVVKPSDLDQQAPFLSATLEYDPFANIQMYGSDTDTNDDSVEPASVDEFSNSSIGKPIQNPPLKITIRTGTGENPRIIDPSFNDHSDDDLVNDIDDLLSHL